ncbi:MAG TPA: AGE family epimerase/isomerase [Blastococcus sp.]|jgi:mannose/cellobiose epimerase-like protein (N-acyl-D-glucosamine 2-epimerase family)|nr:AGE family epimerase/isomerase [Blastococcus sp.]
MTDLDRLLGFAARSRLAGGGFGYLGSDGAVVAGRGQETWIVARMTHVFGLAAMLGRPGAGELARHGVAALTEGPLRDAEHGGWRSSTDDDTKAAYAHAFVLLAGSTAASAGVAGGAELLADAVGVWQDRFWDDDAGMAVEQWDRAWSRLDDYRGLNANMHGVEATLAAADALPVADQTGKRRLRQQARRTTERVFTEWGRPFRWRLPEHFTAGWTPLPEYNRDRPADPFRPYGVTVGHLFEWARLAMHVRSVTPGAPAVLRDGARSLFTVAAGAGDGHAGIPYTLDWQDSVVVAARMHWVQCEAIAAGYVLAEALDDENYRRAADGWRATGERLFADPATGSWHHELTPQGTPASGTWVGQPDAYHLAQMLLLDGRPIRGSLAEMLR